MKPKNWSDFHREALASGMDDPSACHVADLAMEETRRDDDWRETVNLILQDEHWK
jgi:hypothetical protein